MYICVVCKNHYRGDCIYPYSAHFTTECSKPKTSCELCGSSGHLKRFCFVQNYRFLPSNWSEERKADIAKKRADYRAKAVENRAVSMVISDIYGVSI